MNRVVTTALGLAAMAAVPLASVQPVQAATIQLGFILDASGSISSSEWAAIETGLANAINTHIPIAGPNQYEISVVQFGTTASTIVNSVLITDAASRTAVANQILAANQLGGFTNYDAGFSQLRTLMTTGPGVTVGTAFKSYVNFATDGAPNPASANGIAQRNLLIADGVDNISIEGIGITVAAANFLKANICYPGPCDDTPPFNFDTQGFYIGVASAAAYAVAIGNKIQIVTSCGIPGGPPCGADPIPEPASVAIFGLGLLGLGLVTRRHAL